MKAKFSLIFLISLIAAGCTPTMEFMPPPAMLYTNIKAPISIDNYASQISDNKGEASVVAIQYYVFGFSVGDSSSKMAMNTGFIKKGQYADYEYTSVLFNLYQKTSVIVYGEDERQGYNYNRRLF